jgi:mono/diheme cytochrome c family protein
MEDVMLLRVLTAAIGIAIAAQIGFTQNATVKLQVDKTSPTSGQQMFVSYCAPCHGVDGRGHGPVAPALKMAPVDLSLLARNNNGKFPGAHVVSVLQNGSTLPAHGTDLMPVWGPIFSRMNVANPQERMLRINNLSRYLETLQVK